MIACWTEQWKPTKSASLPVPLKMKVHILTLWFYSILPRMLHSMVYMDSVSSCACFSFSRTHTWYPSDILVDYSMSSLAIVQITVQIAFCLERSSPGSWGGGSCISKQPFYFQRSLEKYILFYYQAFVNFTEDTSSFFQCIYLLLWQRGDFALSWTKLNRGCSVLLFCPFLWDLFSAQWSGSGMWFTKSCLISIHIRMRVHILFCGEEVLLCLPELVHCLCKRRWGE